MNVVMVAELLVVSKSVSLALAVAVFINEPGVEGVILIVMTAAAPIDKFPSAQVTVAVPLHNP